MADSNITKKALADALKQTMNEKPFSKISVADICDKCGMNRKSFYYHFKDKYDLLNWIFDVEFIKLVTDDNNSMSEIDYSNLLRLAEYFYNNRDFYRKALEVYGQNSFREHFREFVAQAILIRLNEDFPMEKVSEFQKMFFADAIVIAFERWIMDKDAMSAEEFITQLLSCVHLASIRYEDYEHLLK